MRQTRIGPVLLTVWLVLLCSCAHLGSRELPSSNPRAKEIRTTFDKVVIEQVNFREADVRDVVGFISDEAARLLGNGTGVSLVVAGQTQERRLPESGALRITLEMHHATFRQILNEVCRKTDMAWWIGDKAVVIVPKASVRRVK